MVRVLACCLAISHILLVRISWLARLASNLDDFYSSFSHSHKKKLRCILQFMIDMTK